MLNLLSSSIPQEVIVDGVKYVEESHLTFVSAVNLIGGLLVGFIFSWIFYKHWRARYFAQHSKVPEDLCLDFRKDAMEIEKFLKERTEIVCKATWTFNQAQIAKKPDLYLSWLRGQHLECLLWFLYNIGVGVKFFLVEKEDVRDSEPPTGADKEFVWKWRGKIMHLSALLLCILSSVGLMILAAFVIIKQ